MATNYETQKLTLLKLNDHNYYQWKFSTEMALLKEDLWEMATLDPPAIMTKEWKKRDGSARATIALLIEPNLHNLVRECATAKDMWEKIQNQYEKVSFTSKVFLKRKLFLIKLMNSKNMETYINSMLEVINKLRAAGDNIHDLDIVSTLLCGLPEEYDGLIMGLETREESSLTLDYVLGKLRDEFNRRQEKETHDNHVLVSIEKNQFRKNINYNERRCFGCNQLGHMRNNCPRYKVVETPNYRLDTNRERIFYSQPRNQDSIKPEDSERLEKDRREYNYIGQLTNKETAKQANIEEASEVYYACTSIESINNEEFKEEEWVIDSGATVHMCNNKLTLMNYQPFKNKREIVFANGTMTPALGQGDFRFNDSKIVLENVVYVPELKINLMSVPVLSSTGFKIVFKDSLCTVQQNNVVILQGMINRGIYRMKRINELAMSACIHTWHSRLGHRNLQDIKRMQKEKLVDNLIIEPCNHDDFCDSCQKGKLHQTPFQKTSEPQSEKPFYLLHTDICGPMQTRSLGGGIYFITMMDDYSRYCCIKINKQKSEATETIKNYILHIFNRFGYLPSLLQSDGGGEYENRELNDFLTSKGIKHQITIPYFPQQNRTAERINRTLMEMMKCLMYEKTFSSLVGRNAIFRMLHLQ